MDVFFAIANSLLKYTKSWYWARCRFRNFYRTVHCQAGSSTPNNRARFILIQLPWPSGAEAIHFREMSGSRAKPRGGNVSKTDLSHIRTRPHPSPFFTILPP